MTVVMDGYDTILIGNFYAFPTFQKKYGRWVGISDRSRSGYQLDPAWQAAVGNGAGIGGFFGMSKTRSLSSNVSVLPDC
jgi:SP family general alpha glucoside:H+ symporter-like MFS transporter